MAKDSTDDKGRSGSERRKPVTIDLAAEDVSSKDKNAEPGKKATGPETQADAKASERASGEGAGRPRSGAVPKTDAPAGTTPGTSPRRGGPDEPGEPAAPREPKPKEATAASPKASASPSGTGPQASTAPPDTATAAAQAVPKRQRARPSFFSLVAAAILGGVATVVVLIALLYAGLSWLLPSNAESELVGQIGALEDGINALEKDVTTLLETPVEEVMAPLNEQLTALEQSVTSMLDAQFDALQDDPTVKALQDSLTRLEERLAQMEGSVEQAVAGALSEDANALTAQLNTLAGEIEALKNAAAPDLSVINGAVAELQRDVEALKNAVAPDVTAFNQTLTALQEDVEALRTASAPDLSAIDAALAAAQQDIEALKSTAAADASALGQELATLQGQWKQDMAELRQQLTVLTNDLQTRPSQDRVAAVETQLGDVARLAERSAILGPAIAAEALATALAGGQPFRSELAALRNLGIDAEALDALQPHAAGGLPTQAAIRADFEKAIAAVALSQPVEEDANVLNRLFGSARNLVEVRPANPTAGEGPGAVVARISGALSVGDLKTALSEWNALPEEIRTATAEWARTAETRMIADDLVAKLREAALSRLESEG